MHIFKTKVGILPAIAPMRVKIMRIRSRKQRLVNTVTTEASENFWLYIHPKKQPVKLLEKS